MLAIDGVEGAEIDGDAASPSGLRVRVSQHADQKLVGESIRRVLSDHGFGTDTQLPGEPAPTPHADHSMASVSEFAADSELVTESNAPVATLVSVPPDEDQLVDEDDDEDIVSDRQPETRRVIDLLAEEALSEAELEPESSPEPFIGTTRRTTIARVSVEEGRSGIVVTVTASDGESETELAHATEGGVEHAVVVATARLAAPGVPAPVVIDIDDRRIEGTDIVMIVLDNNGEITTGSAVVGAGRPFALGRATWAAMLV
ncbi:MAG: hypothetical protein DWP92_01745 [Armatimonadetes bacterium]|nr:MAG: hypothetical protein DWP92_01745 [Armatimonadota bacterium]